MPYDIYHLHVKSIPDPGTEPEAPALQADFLPSEPPFSSVR